MKRPLLWLAASVLLLIAVCLGTHYWTTRQLEPWRGSAEPELVWLRREFHLNDETFAKIKAMHEAYQPRCEELCLHIIKANQNVARLMKQSPTLTPELRAAYDEADRVHGECRKAMLEQLYAVSQSMPPDEARRFLEIMRPRLLQVPLHDVPSAAEVSKSK